MGHCHGVISSAVCTLCSVELGFTNAQTTSALIEGLAPTAISTNSQFVGTEDLWCQVQDVQYNSPPEEKDMTCWCAATNPGNRCGGAYVEVDLGTIYTIAEVGTHGCQWEGKDNDEWTTLYKIQYTRTSSTAWTYYGGANGTEIPGNVGATEDNQYEERRTFTPPFEAQYVRLYPLDGHNCTTDWELYGYPPTAAPTIHPTVPSNRPTASPTKIPSRNPSATPSATPSKVPSASPIIDPTESPTTSTTSVPSKGPTNTPTERPTTVFPSVSPTDSPTEDEQGNQDEQDDNNEGGSVTADEVETDGGFSSLELVMLVCTTCIVCALLVVAVIVLKRLRDYGSKADDDDDDRKAVKVASVSLSRIQSASDNRSAMSQPQPSPVPNAGVNVNYNTYLVSNYHVPPVPVAGAGSMYMANVVPVHVEQDVDSQPGSNRSLATYPELPRVSRVETGNEENRDEGKNNTAGSALGDSSDDDVDDDDAGQTAGNTAGMNESHNPNRTEHTTGDRVSESQ